MNPRIIMEPKLLHEPLFPLQFTYFESFLLKSLR